MNALKAAERLESMIVSKSIGGGFKDAIKTAVEVLRGNPCTLCTYSEPTAGDGRPCTICPALGKIRRETEMRVKLDKGAYIPKKAHEQDAGYDLRTPIAFTIPPRGNIVIDTGVHIELPAGKCAVVMSKSGLYTKKKITSTGLIDEGFTGTIMIGLINHSDDPVEFQTGDKISQFYITDYYSEDIEVVDKLAETERGANGYGSTGR